MNLEQLDLKPTDGDQYLASINGKYFYIGPLLYEIVVRAKSLLSPAEIVEDLKQALSVNLNVGQVQAALDNLESQIVVPEEEVDGKPDRLQRSSYIHFRYKLMGGATLEKVSQSLSALFQPTVAAILGGLAILVSGAYWLFVDRPTVSLSAKELLASYVILFCVFFIHELGHAASTKYFKMKPHEISFGFYLIFPVFFADVSEAWSLNKYKRIVINLGGVYFQMLINVILVAFAIVYPSSSVLAAIIYTNLIVVAYSLTPFLRYDGYWIYSDYFEVPNLMRRSLALPYQMWNNYRAGIKEKVNPALLVYSISSYLFFTIMSFFIGRYVHVSAEYVIEEITTNNLSWMEFLGQMEVSFFVRFFIVFFMTCFLTYRLVRLGWKQFIKNF